MQVKRARAILLHFNDDKLTTPVGGLDADDVAIHDGCSNDGANGGCPLVAVWAP